MGDKIKLYLVRHGKDDETKRGGWSGEGLSDEGVIQVHNLTGYIISNKDELEISGLYSSDLERAAQTARPISAALNLSINLTPEFRETNNGLLAGMPHDVANVKYPGLYWNSLEWDEQYPQGESPRMFYERIKAAWTRFAEMTINNNKNAMLITHGGVINVIFTLIDGTVFSNKNKNETVPYASVLPLTYSNGKWRR